MVHACNRRTFFAVHKGAHARRRQGSSFIVRHLTNSKGRQGSQSAELGRSLGGPQRFVIAAVGNIVLVDGAVAVDEAIPPAIVVWADGDVTRPAQGADRLAF